MRIILGSLFLVVLLSACATTSDLENQKRGNKEKKVYVFDDVNVPDSMQTSATALDTAVAGLKVEISDTTNLNSLMLKQNVRYFVQVGAFTTKARAERFVKLNENRITFPMQISFSPLVKLFVVRLPFFRKREEAERVRNALWKTKYFKDAFIVTEIK